VEPANLAKVQAHLDGVAHSVIGTVSALTVLEVVGVHTPNESMSLAALRSAWDAPSDG
jgi:hypothetical protein